MDLRALLVGSERGAALAIVAAALGTTLAIALGLPADQPLQSISAADVAVAVLYSLPAVLVGAYDGGLGGGWLAEGVPFAVLFWPTTAASADATTGWTGRLLVTAQAGLLAAVVLGTLGVALGRGLGWLWREYVADAAR